MNNWNPCILTGASGEDPDDCTTHGHESDTPKTVPHTPTPVPWRFKDGRVFAFEPSAEDEVLICDTAPDNVALTEYDETNAAHIVLCVNSHDRLKAENEKLRAAILAMLDAVDYTARNCSQRQPVGEVLDQRLITLARAALAAAQP